MKHQQKLHVIIPMIVYPFDLVLSIGESDDELMKSLDKNYDLSAMTAKDRKIIMYHELAVAIAIRFSFGLFLLRMKQKPKEPADYGFLHHELFHTVTRFMELIDCKLVCDISGEPYAYLYQYLTTEIYKHLK